MRLKGDGVKVDAPADPINEALRSGLPPKSGTELEGLDRAEREAPDGLASATGAVPESAPMPPKLNPLLSGGFTPALTPPLKLKVALGATRLMTANGFDFSFFALPMSETGFLPFEEAAMTAPEVWGAVANRGTLAPDIVIAEAALD